MQIFYNARPARGANFGSYPAQWALYLPAAGTYTAPWLAGYAANNPSGYTLSTESIENIKWDSQGNARYIEVGQEVIRLVLSNVPIGAQESYVLRDAASGAAGCRAKFRNFAEPTQYAGVSSPITDGEAAAAVGAGWSANVPQWIFSGSTVTASDDDDMQVEMRFFRVLGVTNPIEIPAGS